MYFLIPSAIVSSVLLVLSVSLISLSTYFSKFPNRYGFLIVHLSQSGKLPVVNIAYFRNYIVLLKEWNVFILVIFLTNNRKNKGPLFESNSNFVLTVRTLVFSPITRRHRFLHLWKQTKNTRSYPQGCERVHFCHKRKNRLFNKLRFCWVF